MQVCKKKNDDEKISIRMIKKKKKINIKIYLLCTKDLKYFFLPSWYYLFSSQTFSCMSMNIHQKAPKYLLRGKNIIKKSMKRETLII